MFVHSANTSLTDFIRTPRGERLTTGFNFPNFLDPRTGNFYFFLFFTPLLSFSLLSASVHILFHILIQAYGAVRGNFTRIAEISSLKSSILPSSNLKMFSDSL